MLYIDLSYACYGVVVSDGIVIQTPPIAIWMIGRTVDSVVKWVTNKGGIVYPI